MPHPSFFSIIRYYYYYYYYYQVSFFVIDPNASLTMGTTLTFAAEYPHIHDVYYYNY